MRIVRWSMASVGSAVMGSALLAVAATLALPNVYPPDAAPGTAEPTTHVRGSKVIATFTTRSLQRIHKTSDAATAQIDPATGLAQYSEIARNTGGALGDYLKTIENMGPALKATSGDFAPQCAALSAAHTAMVRAALGRLDVPSVEQQGRLAIQEANEAINAQGKMDEYTENLVKTGALERQWGRRPDQQFAVSPGAEAGPQSTVPV